MQSPWPGSENQSVSPIRKPTPNIHHITYLLNVESSSNINKHLLPIRQPALNIQRAGQGNEDLIAAIGTLLLGSGHAVVY